MSKNREISQLEYLKREVKNNLGESVVQLDEIHIALSRFVKKKNGKFNLASLFSNFIQNNETKLNTTFIEQYIYPKKKFLSSPQKKKQKIFYKKQQLGSCNCCKHSCKICFAREMFNIKSQRMDGSKSRGIYYKNSENMFVLMCWLLSRVEYFQVKYPTQLQKFVSEARLSARNDFGEVHGIFFSVFCNVFFYNFIAFPVFLDIKNEIINVLYKNVASRFQEEGFRICENYSQLLQFEQLKWRENFEILPSFLSRKERQNSKKKNFSFLNNLLISLNKEYIVSLKMKFTNKITALQPQFGDSMSCAVINIYRSARQKGYLLNLDKHLDTTQIENVKNTISVEEIKRKPIKEIYLSDMSDFQNNATEIQAEKNKKQTNSFSNYVYTDKVGNQHILGAIFNLQIPTTILEFIQSVSFEANNRIYKSFLDPGFQSITSKLFPVQRHHLPINLNSLNCDLLIHSFSGMCCSPSYLQAQSMIDIFSQKYSNSKQFEYLYFHEFYHIIFTKIKDKNNFSVKKNFLELNSISKRQNWGKTILKYDLEYNKKYNKKYNKENQNKQIIAIEIRFLELTQYFKLTVFDATNTAPISFLEKIKFNEIVNFMIFEAAIITQINFSLNQYDNALVSENLFKICIHPSYQSVFHSFSFNKKPENSKNNFLKDIIFKFPTKQEILADKFLQTAKDNFNLVFANTEKIMANLLKAQPNLKKRNFPWLPKL